MDKQCSLRLHRNAKIADAERSLGSIAGLGRLSPIQLNAGEQFSNDLHFQHPYKLQTEEFKSVSKHYDIAARKRRRSNVTQQSAQSALAKRRRAQSLGESQLAEQICTSLTIAAEQQTKFKAVDNNVATADSESTQRKQRSEATTPSFKSGVASGNGSPLRRFSLVSAFSRKESQSSLQSATPNSVPTIRASLTQLVKQVKDSVNANGGGNANTDSRRHSPLSRLTPIGEDWLYLALLGIIMAVLSFSMDTLVSLLLDSRLWTFEDLSEANYFVQFVGWCLMPILLVTLSSAFVHACSPTAVGSGIPEMKTILRGVVLNEYLTFRTLVSKIVGLTFTLGSGLPLGKEGPFVHIASIVATLLGNLVASFKGIYENESRTSEMLSAACAVGVAATFYAPIGGVLFSIEVTTVYFAVRNYWRGFFAACCGATVWRLLGYWMKNDESVSALFKTNFNTEYPFDPVELLGFCFVGATCGLGGAAYVKLHRDFVHFFRRRKTLSNFFQQNRFVYPIAVTFVITSITFPPFFGQFIGATLNTHVIIEHMFSNRTWSYGKTDLVSEDILDSWTTPYTSFYINLALYMLTMFLTSIFASTIPTPSGIFIPVLKIGAAYGRLVGELVHMVFPLGIRYAVSSSAQPRPIVPGSYAVAGAAAFSGAVTHTISTSVILFEMTGQIVHIIPVILAVLVSNAVCQSLEPSIYDSMIEIKKLPYLPQITSSNSVSHKILVRDFMNTQIAFVWKDKCTYEHVRNLLVAHPKLTSFPLVESQSSMKLLGSVPRPDLLKLLYLHLGRERRLQEVHARRASSTTMTPATTSIQDLAPAVLTNESTIIEMDKLRVYGDNDSLRTSPTSPSINNNDNYDHDSVEQQINVCELTKSEQTAPASRSIRLESQSDLYNKNSPCNLERIDSSLQLLGLQFANDASMNPSSSKVLAWLPSQSNNLSQKQTYNQSAVNSPVTNGKVALRTLPKSILKPSPSGTALALFAANQSSTLASNTTNINSNQQQSSRNQYHRDVLRYSQYLKQKSNYRVTKQMVNDEQQPASVNLHPKQLRRVRLPRLRVVDMSVDEQREWELEQLKHAIDVSRCEIDEAPFQLVQQTSLYRVHTLFSMLGLSHAYVTSFGRLVGIVALKDIRLAIERMME